MDSTKEKDPQQAHIEDTSTSNDAEKAKHLVAHDETSIDEVVDAKNATDQEHNTTLWEGIKRYRKAIFWSFAFSLCIVMDGYGAY